LIKYTCRGKLEIDNINKSKSNTSNDIITKKVEYTKPISSYRMQNTNEVTVNRNKVNIK